MLGAMTSRAQIPPPPPRVAVSPAELRRLGLEAGLDAVGFTTADVLEPARSALLRRRAAGLNGAMQFTYRNPERSTDPGQLLRGAASMVVGLLGYQRAEPPAPDEAAGRVARYARDDFYRQLARGLEPMAALLRANGWTTRVVADSNDLVDRNAAWRAGLAWYGKNANLLVPGAGSWFVVGVIVTDAPLAQPSEARPAGDAGGVADSHGDGTAEPLADGCGPCVACLDGCPTGALVAPGVLDARRCIAWLVQSADPIPVEHRGGGGRPHLRLRRLPGPVPREPAPGPAPAAAGRGGDGADLGSGAMDPHRRRRRPARPARPLVRGQPRPRRHPPHGAGGPGQHGGARRPGVGAAAGRLSGPSTTRFCGPMRCGRPAVSASDMLADGAAADPDPLVRAEVVAPVQARTPLR